MMCIWLYVKVLTCSMQLQTRDPTPKVRVNGRSAGNADSVRCPSRPSEQFGHTIGQPNRAESARDI